jgi:hypothetical protein
MSGIYKYDNVIEVDVVTEVNGNKTSKTYDLSIRFDQ